MAAEFDDNPGDIDAAAAGMLALIVGTGLVRMAHLVGVTGNIDSGVECDRREFSTCPEATVPL